MNRRLGLAVLLTACHSPAPPAPSGFVDRAETVEGVTYRYKLFIPDGYSAAQKWPVVLFLHGMGERGNDNEKPARYSIGAYLRKSGQAFPAIVVFPQVPADSYWTGQPARAALAALETTVRDFRGDRDRLYLTGLSMGGYGSWELASSHPHLFAAAAIICGGIVAPKWDSMLRVRTVARDASDPYALIASRIRALPVWIFHGDSDTTIPVAESRRMTAALRQVGDTVRYTEYPRVGHNAWDRSYADPDLWTWLFAQRRAAH